MIKSSTNPPSSNEIFFDDFSFLEDNVQPLPEIDDNLTNYFLSPSNLTSQKSLDGLNFGDDLLSIQMECNPLLNRNEYKSSEDLFKYQSLTIPSHSMNFLTPVEEETKDSVLRDAIPLPLDNVKRIIKNSSPHELIDQNIPLYREKKGGKNGKIFFIKDGEKIYVERTHNAKRRLTQAYLNSKKMHVSTSSNFTAPPTGKEKKSDPLNNNETPKSTFTSPSKKQRTEDDSQTHHSFFSASEHPLTRNLITDSEILKDALPYKPKKYRQRCYKDKPEILIDPNIQLYRDIKNGGVFFIEDNKRIYTKYTYQTRINTSASVPYFSSSEAHISQRLLSAEQPIIQTTIETPSAPQTALHSFKPLFHTPIPTLQSSSSETDKSDNINIDESLSIFNRG